MAKNRVTVTLDRELLGWLDGEVKSKRFANRSHAFEFLIYSRMKKEEN